jgi:parallel beta helix pectate lyase-like protein
MKTINTPRRLFAMRPARLLLFLLPLLLLALPSALNAQLTKIFVASTGNDANDGSRGAPKRNFQPAHDAVATGGQIVVLDTAGYGRLSINKSVSVTVPPGVNGFVTATPGNNGINVDANASAVVSLRGLIVEGGNDSTGILAFNVGNLAIEDCTVRNFQRGIYVISFTPANVYVRNTVVRGCSLAGLDLENGGNVAVSSIVTDCQFDQNSGTGVLAQLSNPSGKVDLTLGDCVISGNGIGVQAGGATTVVRLDNCAVTTNNTGTATANGGGLLSRTNNTIENNAGGNGAPVGYSAK